VRFIRESLVAGVRCGDHLPSSRLGSRFQSGLAMFGATFPKAMIWPAGKSIIITDGNRNF
jgi:hypothetical protein